MTPEQKLFDTISATTAVTDLVAGRIFADFIPEDVAIPCLAMIRVGSSYEVLLSGGSAAEKVSHEVHCFAKSRSAAEALCDAVLAGVEPEGFMPVSRSAEQVGDPEEDIEVSILSLERWHI